MHTKLFDQILCILNHTNVREFYALRTNIYLIDWVWGSYNSVWRKLSRSNKESFQIHPFISLTLLWVLELWQKRREEDFKRVMFEILFLSHNYFTMLTWSSQPTLKFFFFFFFTKIYSKVGWNYHFSIMR